MQRLMAARASWVLALCVGAAAPCGASEIWRNDWIMLSPPTFGRASFGQGSGPSRAVLAPGGNVVMGGLSFSMREYQFAEVGVDGSAGWTANVGVSSVLDWNGPTTMLATEDGGAIVAFGNEDVGESEYIARIDGGGLFVWMRRLRAQAIAQVSPTRIVASGRQLSMLDSATGNVIWQTAYGDRTWLPYVVFDADGAVYTTSISQGDVSAVKHDADGHIAWHVTISTDDFHGGNAVGAADGIVYYMTSSGLRALRTADGYTRWTAPAFGTTVLAGSPSEPIVFGPSGPITRLNATNGTVRWSTPLTAWDATAVVGDRLIVSTDVSGRTLTAVDIASGATGWTTQLPAQNNAGHGVQYFALGGLSDGAFTVVGRVGSLPNPPSIQRVALADGSLVSGVTVPIAAQGPYATSIMSGTDHVAGVQAAWTTELPQVRVRRLETAFGSEAWTQDQILDLGLDPFDTPPYTVSPDVADTGDAIAAAATAYSSATNNSLGTGAVWLGLYDAANGAPRWQSVLHDANQGETHGSTPVADAAGDVYVAEGIATQCDPPINQPCGRRRVYKLSHADGSVAWGSDSGVVYTDGSGHVDPPNLAIAGADVLAFGPLDGPSTLVARSRDNGAVHWSSEVLSPAVYDVFPVADGVLVTGRDSWAKVDATTGATLWSFTSYLPACNAFCNAYYGATPLPNGDLLVPGEGDYKPLLSELTTDGSGTYHVSRLDPNRDDVHSAAIQVFRDSADQIWLRLQRSVLSGSGTIVVLAKFDPATGTLQSQQVVRGSGSDPLELVLTGAWLGAPESNRLLIASTDINPPFPTISGNSAVNTTVTAHGDLAVSLDVDHPSAGPSQTIAFHARMTYSGDVSITGAHLNVYLPWGSGVRNPTCVPTTATGCTLDIRGGHVRAIVNLTPGATVDLTGEVLVVDANFDETPTIGAVGWGPVGLDEPDTLNNVARQIVEQGLFANGFDG